MFQYGVLLAVELEGEIRDVLYEYPVHGLDTALESYKKLVKMYPSKKFKLVRIEYKEMIVIDD